MRPCNQGRLRSRVWREKKMFEKSPRGYNSLCPTLVCTDVGQSVRPMADSVASLESARESGVTNSAVARELRRRIVQGLILPGDRMPPRSEVEGEFGTTKRTVQRAFDVLQEEGFIATFERRGTFVAERPPHLTRYGLVLPASSTFEGPGRFWKALSDEATRLRDGGQRDMAIFHGVDMSFDSDEARRLSYEMETHQMVGVIFGFSPGGPSLEAIQRAGDLPVAAVMEKPHEAGIPGVRIFYGSFISQALQALADAGCHRVGVVAPAGLCGYEPLSFVAEAARFGLESRPYWWQPVNLDSTITARPQVHLLMNPNQAERPDGLIIADDNLVEHVLDGLADAAVSVPRDVQVVAHANFPLDGPPALPMRRLGYPVQKVLGSCLELIDRQCAGEPVPALTPVQAMFEEDFARLSL